MRSRSTLANLLLMLSLVVAPARAEPTAEPAPAPEPADTEAAPGTAPIEAPPAPDAAQPLPAAQPTPATEAEAREHPCRWVAPDEEMIDQTKRRLHETLCGASLWLDGLFGDRRNLEAARGAHGRIDTSLAYSQFSGFQQRVRADLRIELPNLTQRASAFIGRDDENNFVRDRSESLVLRSAFPSIDDHDAWLAGLGYSLPGNKRFSTTFRVGVRSLRQPRFFAQSQLRYNAYSDLENLVSLRLAPFWNTRDGFGITPGVDCSHVLTPTRLLRWSNIGTRSESSQGFDWRSSLILYQGLGQRRGIAFEAFVRGATQDNVPLREHGVRTILRLPLARERLFADLVTGYSWPKEDPNATRHGSYLVGLTLELPFGERK